jgi:hypothetical protein
MGLRDTGAEAGVGWRQFNNNDRSTNRQDRNMRRRIGERKEESKKGVKM